MNRHLLHQICAPLPGAEVSDPWGGHDAWKVGGKMFASVGARDLGVAVKTADADFARMMIEAGDAERAPYFHASWILLRWSAPETLIRDRVVISYDLIRSKLTKKVPAGMAERAP
ncbi:MmcQ/YjbR family DNA-binding protein [Pseudooceanicola algae]|uniref:MmcQ/YjbR family DNA-binding protein n=1 Tax=Pseudooceanicola algae TaxID=1537215 RepID=A0A418SBX6_9RHOB|nr:MmcQ/YjbR family DNA-binding protein [Pseudooceanicola algae]QPM89903.1 hypothetical protein PSAL_011320 [Pseudooceanicola algae]